MESASDTSVLIAVISVAGGLLVVLCTTFVFMVRWLRTDIQRLDNKIDKIGQIGQSLNSLILALVASGTIDHTTTNLYPSPISPQEPATTSPGASHASSEEPRSAPARPSTGTAVQPGTA